MRTQLTVLNKAEFDKGNLNNKKTNTNNIPVQDNTATNNIDTNPNNITDTNKKTNNINTNINKTKNININRQTNNTTNNTSSQTNNIITDKFNIDLNSMLKEARNLNISKIKDKFTHRRPISGIRRLPQPGSESNINLQTHQEDSNEVTEFKPQKTSTPNKNDVREDSRKPSKILTFDSKLQIKEFLMK